MSDVPTPSRAVGATPYLDARLGLPGDNGSSPVNPDYAFLPNARVPLAFAIEIGGVKVSEITVRRPKVKDNMAVQALGAGKSDEEQGIILLQHLTGLAPDEFQELDLSDVKRLGEWLTVFTSARKTT